MRHGFSYGVAYLGGMKNIQHMHLDYRALEVVGLSQQKLNIPRWDFAARRKSGYICCESMRQWETSMAMLQFLLAL